MPFTFKLSVRLALIKGSVVLAAAAFIACEVPGRRVTDPPNNSVVLVVTTPDTVILDPLQAQQFVAFGRTQAGESVAVAVQWSATGGAITSSGVYTADTLAGDYVVTAGAVSALATGSSRVRNRGSLVQVVLTPSSASLPAGGSLQFAAYGIRKTGDSVAVAVNYSATGGAISAAGLYSAGPNAGVYKVIATQSGGTLADTASVTVTVTSPPPPRRRHRHRRHHHRRRHRRPRRRPSCKRILRVPGLGRGGGMTTASIRF